MGGFEDLFRQLDSAGGIADPSLSGMLLALLLAFVIGQVVAWIYIWTHSGLSYSRTFSQSLVMLTIIATMVMYVIGNNVVAAFGLMGALAIIRFRNVLKDTRDTAFVFMTLVLGMATGTQRFAVAVVGGAFLLLVTAWLHMSSFGTRISFDGHLSYRLSGSHTDSGGVLAAVLRRHCRRLRTVTVHDGGEEIEYVQQVRLRNRDLGHEMVEELRGTQGVRDVTLVLRDDHAEL
jgi:hypothetical protein